MAKLLLVATAQDRSAVEELSRALSGAGLDVESLDLAGTGSDDKWRAMVAACASDAFVVFCLTKQAAGDALFVKLLWQAAPMSADPLGRFIFALLDPSLAENADFAPFLQRHFKVEGPDAPAIAAHVAEFAGPLAKSVAERDERRRVAAEMARLNPPISRSEGAPRGIGSSDAHPQGVGAGTSPREERMWREMDESRAPTSAPPTAPAPAPSAAGASLRASPPSHAPERSAARAAPPASMAPAAPVKARAAGRVEKVDAAAFAPKTLRRGNAELVRVSLYRPKDRALVERAARLADARAQVAGAPQRLGSIARGARISAVIDARGCSVDQTRQDGEWSGQPLDFSFAVEPSTDESVTQALFTIRVLIDDAQIGAIVFVRPIAAPRKKKNVPAGPGASERLRPVQRVFLSYSSGDRAPASLIASAYRRAGIACFFDRTGLKSGEEWSPRLLREIDRADLFHLCWSQSAARSNWVEKETEHALTHRRKSWGKKPDITIQMLDGPPWAPHPQSLDALNFDDFERAAIAGYARGEGA